MIGLGGWPWFLAWPWPQNAGLGLAFNGVFGLRLKGCGLRLGYSFGLWAKSFRLAM